LSREHTLAELEALQEAFTELLRTPLDRRSGTLRARTEAYPRALLSQVEDGPQIGRADRLAVYHRQVWFRHLTLLQTSYPLLARLLGMWHFNDLAARYLLAHPPRHYDMAETPVALPQHLAGQPYTALGHALPHTLLCDAAELDAAITRVFRAPKVEPLDPRTLEPSRFASLTLRLSPAVSFLATEYGVVPARREAMASAGEGRISAPARLAERAHWVVLRTPDGYGVAELDAVAYGLYTRLARTSVATALGELEASVSDELRASLPGRVSALLRESVRAGFWAAAP
jgi:Putative DNA-binding domain